MQKMEDRLFNNKHLDAQTSYILFYLPLFLKLHDPTYSDTLCIHIFIEQTFLIIVKFNMDAQYGNVEYTR